MCAAAKYQPDLEGGGRVEAWCVEYDELRTYTAIKAA